MKIVSRDCVNYLNTVVNNTNVNKYPNLAPLKMDTVSFGARTDIDDSINVDFIEDKEISKIVTKVLTTNSTLTRDEIFSVLEYFNYEWVRNTGDEQFKHKYEKINSRFTMKAKDSKLDHLYTNIIKRALKGINKTGGELYFTGDNLPTSEQIKEFNKTIVDCPDELKNPYRLRLEQERKVKQQQQVNETPKVDYESQIMVKNCKKAIADAKESIRADVYEEARLFIEENEQIYAESEEVKNACVKAREQLKEIEKCINSLEYSQGDDYSSNGEKISDAETKALSILLDIETKIESEISAWEVNNKERGRILLDIKSKYQQIKKLFREVKDKTTSAEFQTAGTRLVELQIELNTQIRRPASKMIVKLEKCSNEELLDIDAQMDDYLQKAIAKKEEYDSIYNHFLQKQIRKNSPVSKEKNCGVKSSETPQVKDSDTKQTAQVTETQEVRSTVPVSNSATVIEKQPQVIVTPFAQNVFNLIEENICSNSVPSYAKSITDLIANSFTSEEINKFESMNYDDFTKFVLGRIRTVFESDDAKINYRAMKIAVLDEIALCAKPGEKVDEIYFLSDSEITKIQKEFLQGKKVLSSTLADGKSLSIRIADKPDLESLDEAFSKLVSPLTDSEVDQLVSELATKYTPTIQQDKLKASLSFDGKYLMAILDNDVPASLKSKLLRFIYSDFDKQNGSNFLQQTLSVIDKERIDNRINTLLDGVDWTDL